MKHTTGQWKAVAQMPEGYSIETNEGKVIAFTQCDEDYNSENPIIRAEEMANAKMIAASSDLYNAAYNALLAIYAMSKNKQGFYQYLINDLSAAIKKATE
jgi:hypothetical protein